MSQTTGGEPGVPQLQDVSDERSVAIFNPRRISGDDEHWIQIDVGHAVSVEEWR